MHKHTRTTCADRNQSICCDRDWRHSSPAFLLSFLSVWLDNDGGNNWECCVLIFSFKFYIRTAMKILYACSLNLTINRWLQFIKRCNKILFQLGMHLYTLFLFTYTLQSLMFELLWCDFVVFDANGLSTLRIEHSSVYLFPRFFNFVKFFRW